MASIDRDGLRSCFVFILGSMLVISSGCGSSTPVVTDPKDKAERVKEASLSQLGDLLRLRQEESAPPPGTGRDIEKYKKAFPLACGKVKDGQIVLIYGVPVQEGVEDTIIAYEMEAPASGGHVLMQDGKTIKKMTADEFKGAKKAR
jgi:hypothetical protein